MTALIDSMMQWLPWAGAVLALVAVATTLYRGYKARKAVQHFALILHRMPDAASFQHNLEGVSPEELERFVAIAVGKAAALKRAEQELALAGLLQPSIKGRKLYLKSLLSDRDNQEHATAA